MRSREKVRGKLYIISKGPFFHLKYLSSEQKRTPISAMEDHEVSWELDEEFPFRLAEQEYQKW
jgi:hypothetical protein